MFFRQSCEPLYEGASDISPRDSEPAIFLIGSYYFLCPRLVEVILLNQPAHVFKRHPVVFCVMPIPISAFAVNVGSKLADFGF